MSTSEKPTSYANYLKGNNNQSNKSNIKRRSSQNWINPTMRTNMKQGSNRYMNIIKSKDKDQFLQVIFFKGIQFFSMDIVSIVENLDIRLSVAGLLDITEI
jgi:thymidine kinase